MPQLEHGEQRHVPGVLQRPQRQGGLRAPLPGARRSGQAQGDAAQLDTPSEPGGAQVPLEAHTAERHESGEGHHGQVQSEGERALRQEFDAHGRAARLCRHRPSRLLLPERGRQDNGEPRAQRARHRASGHHVLAAARAARQPLFALHERGRVLRLPARRGRGQEQAHRDGHTLDDRESGVPPTRAKVRPHGLRLSARQPVPRHGGRRRRRHQRLLRGHRPLAMVDIRTLAVQLCPEHR